MAEVKINGLADLKKTLESLPAKLEKNVIRGGLRAGGKVIATEAKRRCPEGSGTEHPGALRDSIRVSAQRSEKGRVAVAIKAGGGKDKVFYAHLVEYGTAAHFIKPASRKSLFLGGVYSEGVSHPGAKAHPFMRPAMDGAGPQAVQAVANYIANRLPKELAKLR